MSTAPGRAVLRLCLLLLGLLGAGLALRAFAGELDAALLDRLVVGQGAWGQLIFVLLAGLACATGVPRQAAGFAAGYAFAFWPGLALVMAAQVLGCALDFFWARGVAQDWARRRLSGQPAGRLARLEVMLADNAFTVTLIVRLLPVGNNTAFSLLGGVASVRALPFLAGSAIGYVPQTLVFVLLGGGARVAGWQRIALAGMLFAASLALGFWLYRRHRGMVINAGS